MFIPYLVGTGMLDAAPLVLPIPDAVGSLEAEADLTLEASNFDSTSIYDVNDDYVFGVVFSQVPAAGTLAAPGTIVTLYVSAGPRPGSEDHDAATIRRHRQYLRQQAQKHTAARDMSDREAAQIRADVEAVMFEPEVADSPVEPLVAPAPAAPAPLDQGLLAALMSAPPPAAPPPASPAQQQFDAALRIAQFAKGLGRG